MSSTEDEVQVGIPRAIHHQIELRIRGTRFKSVGEYVRAVLEDSMGRGQDGADKGGLSEEDESRIKEKLKALGYI